MDEDIPTLVDQDSDELVASMAPLTLGDNKEPEKLPRVPVTVITGFLGSGKVCANSTCSILLTQAPHENTL